VYACGDAGKSGKDKNYVLNIQPVFSARGDFDETRGIRTTTPP
jgi:hypothetical protein